MSSIVLSESIAKGVTLITLNRPERRNALSIDLLEMLCDKVETMAKDSDHRVVVLRGAGPVFSAGLDLKEASDSSLVERSAGCVETSLDLDARNAFGDDRCSARWRVRWGCRFVGGLRYCRRGRRPHDRIPRSTPRTLARLDLRRLAS